VVAATGGSGFPGDSPIPALADAPPEPYVREIHDAHGPGNEDDPWHIAVRAAVTGQAMIRCQLEPLVPPIEWRSIAPEASLDAVMCPFCLDASG
jgi:hypothetical protein